MKIRRKASPHRFLTACRIRGWRPHDSTKDVGELVRDASHEAFHALTVGLEDWSDREVIHAKLVRCLAPSALWVHEVEARLTEQEVVRRFGLEILDLESWIAKSCFEAIRTRVPHLDPDRSMKIAAGFPRDRVVENAVRVLRFERFPVDRLSWDEE